MNLSRICLLDSVRNAEQFLAEHNHEEWELFALHPAVVDVLHARGVACTELSDFITFEEQLEIKQALFPGGTLHSEADGILTWLDSLVPTDFQSSMGLARPIRLFESMFTYMLAHGLWGKAFFEKAMRRVLSSQEVKEVWVYEALAEYRYFTPREILEHSLAPESGCRVRVLTPADRSPVPLPDSIFSPLPQSPRALPTKASLRPSTPQRQGTKTLALLLPEYDLHPLLTRDLPFNLLLWPYDHLPQIDGLDISLLARRAQSMAANLCTALSCDAPRPLPGGFIERIRMELAAHGAEYLTGLALLDALLRDKCLDALAWGCSPTVNPATSLLVRYAMGDGIPVIGMQHGGNNGVQDCGYFSVLGEYSCCTHFLGYGHTRDHVHPSLLPFIHNNILPIGSTRIALNSSIPGFKPTPGRVLFPITNSLPIQECGRITPAFLANAQRLILECLEARPDLNTWVKPFLGANSSNFACSHQLAGLKNVKVAKGLFTHAMESLRPELVVAEFPSSPLFESLPFDVDIFVLMDPLFRFTEHAEDLLRRRAHVFHSTEDLTNALATYGRAALPRLRDNAFFDSYLHRPDAEKNLVEQMTALIQQQPAIST